MAGVSIARPQDVAGAIFGNPATLAQFQGTQFSMGGAWVEGYPRITYTPYAEADFTALSGTEGFAAPEIGVIQDLRGLGLPGAFGLGFATTSGGGAEYRGRAPGSGFLNDTTGELAIFGITAGAGFQLTDRLSAGGSFTLGTAMEQLGLIADNIATAMVHDYGVRATLGVNFDLNPSNTIGFFYQSKEHFQFPNGIRFNSTYHDVTLDQPATLGLGVANRSFLDGNLLIAADVYYKLWEDAALYRDVFVNQWAFAVGTQLTRGAMKYRLGYAYNGNPINHSVGDQLDGLGIGRDAVQLFQAASLPMVNQHRLTGGIGREGFLFPNLDLDLFAGGLFKATDQFGNTQASAAIYYIGMGMTWRFGAAAEHTTEQ